MNTDNRPAPASRLRSAIVLLAAVVAAAVTARLGVWQLDRAAQKQGLQQTLEARRALPPLQGTDLATTPPAGVEQHSRVVQLAGTWVPGATLFLENRQMHGRPGFFVVTPLRLVGRTDAVLVQRGWAPRDLRDRSLLPTVATPTGAVRLEGRVAPPPGRLYDFAGGAASGPLRQNLDVAALSVELGLSLRAVSVLQTGAAGEDGLLRDWPAPAVDIQKHHGYAFQWFALCALITGLYVWFQLVRPRLSRTRHAAAR